MVQLLLNQNKILRNRFKNLSFYRSNYNIYYTNTNFIILEIESVPSQFLNKLRVDLKKLCISSLYIKNSIFYKILLTSGLESNFLSKNLLIPLTDSQISNSIFMKQLLNLFLLHVNEHAVYFFLFKNIFSGFEITFSIKFPPEITASLVYKNQHNYLSGSSSIFLNILINTQQRVFLSGLLNLIFLLKHAKL